MYAIVLPPIAVPRRKDPERGSISVNKEVCVLNTKSAFRSASIRLKVILSPLISQSMSITLGDDGMAASTPVENL